MDYDKLEKLLMLSTSENDHEALAAIRKANFLLRQANKTWTGFFAGLPKPKASQPPRPEPVETISEMLEYCMENCGPSVLDFIESLNDFYEEREFLTDNQVSALEKIFHKTMVWGRR